jgi:hypothetical protein
MRSSTLVRLSLFAAIGGTGLVAACSAEPDGSSFTQGAGVGGAGGAGSTATTGDFVTATTGAGAGILGTEPPCEGVDPNIDNDSDGWTGASGDCNDCTAQMNPGAQDYSGNAIDEDCNGVDDDNLTECDASLGIDSADGFDGARAIGLCKMASDGGWGVVSAEYVRADGQPLQGGDGFCGGGLGLAVGRGLLSGFGPAVNPQEGVKLLALSSGTARQPSDPGYESVGGCMKDFNPHGAPPGFPKESPSCPGVVTGEPYDSAGLRLTIRTPTNAKSLSFNLNFYTYEFPGYICDTYNDFFVALLSPVPAGQADGNISFDSQGNTISVNAGFLEVCYPQMAGGKNFPCALGAEQLAGTGFDEQPNGSAATGWLKTSSPVVNPGEDITMMFAIWDSGDQVLDSTVLIDNFSFEVEEAETVTEPIDIPE